MTHAVIIGVSLLLLPATLGLAKDKVELPPPAPLPELISQARTVMLTSEVGELAYDEAYKVMKEWGRFQLTQTQEKADLIFALQSDRTVRPFRPKYVLIPYPVPPYDEYLWLVVYDAKNNGQLWAQKQTQRRAMREKNRAKEIVLAVDALFKQLRERIPAK